MQHRSSLLRFTICLLAGLLVYALVFGLIARRPESAGMLDKYFQHKLAYAESINSPKLMLLGASNVRYSHRCETISKVLSYPCVNAGINNEVALDILLTGFGETLNSNDTVYLPLSYEPYMWSQKTLDALLSSVYLFQYAPDKLSDYGWNKQLNAFFYYDIPFLFSSFAEMLLPRFGIRRMAGKNRPFGIETLNEYGDETGHTDAQSQPFKGLVRPFEWSPPNVDSFNPKSSDSGKLLLKFLTEKKSEGITIIGGLPTVIDAEPVPDEIIERLRSLYKEAGQDFIVLPNRSQYPRSCFYDTGYHLKESCQIEHSRNVAEALRPYIKGNSTRWK